MNKTMENYRDKASRDFQDSYRLRGSGKDVNADVSYGPNRYMRNRQPDQNHDHGGEHGRSPGPTNSEGQNIRVGSDLYRHHDHTPHDRYGHRRDDDFGQSQQGWKERELKQRDWDEGNFFHTGPAPKGSRVYEREQDIRQRGNYNRHPHSPGDQHGHYGARSESVYRRLDNLNYGDHGRRQQSSAPFGSGYEPHRQPIGLDNNPHTEAPGTDSRYKEDDYRYGSGNHNFYREGRYQQDGGIGQGFKDNKGFFERVGDGIRDTWESITSPDGENYPRSGNRRYGDSDADFRRSDRGYESGPRWADESETGSSSADPYRRGRQNASENDRWSGQNRNRREDRW